MIDKFAEIELPDIPYFTRMDLFLFGSTLLVFSSLIEVVITSSLVRTDRLGLAQRIDQGCRVGFPVFFALIAVWTLVLGV